MELAGSSVGDRYHSQARDSASCWGHMETELHVCYGEGAHSGECDGGGVLGGVAFGI